MIYLRIMPKSKVFRTNKTKILTSLDNITKVSLPKIILKRDKNNNLSITHIYSNDDGYGIKQFTSSEL